jgi:excisionase family DNA binding protein
MQNRELVMIQCGDLLRVEEAAQLATVRPSTIRAWVAQGKLPRVKLGRCTRILRSDLQDFIRAGRNPHTVNEGHAEQGDA